MSLASCLAGCSQLAYYRQSALGQWDIVSRRQAIDDLLADDSRNPQLRARLARVREIRRFARQVLALPVDGNFTYYADLQRDYALFALYAAPEFSTELKTWCYPIAGCVAYRGYFDRRMLERDAARLRARGFDVYVAAVPAYSTLGWFNDPLLNTVIGWPEPQLAGLIFHELAHAKLYVPGDTAFNESFATAVEQAGVERWLRERGDATGLQVYRRALRRQAAFARLARQTRARLQSLYHSDLVPAAMREEKRRILARSRQDLQRLWGNEQLPETDWQVLANNAGLGSVAVYHSYVAAFRAMLQGLRGDWPAFYTEAARIGALTAHQRELLLSRGTGRQTE